MLRPPKSHTRASAMANSYVNSHTAKSAMRQNESTKTLFKMKKFLQVEPRTSSKNPSYVPTKRAGMAHIATRPNPIFGSK
mmetsp:Transcript_932/g.1441  ORF Transcript_932/g.1441 Transcript_932/m.1441 type:complete len:80 (-) Transcript_932:107-346(-)